MRDMNDAEERTVGSPTLERSTDGGVEPEWRPGDEPPLGEATSVDAWSSPEAAPAADVVPTPGRPPADPRSFVGPEDTPARGLRTPPVPSLAAIDGHPLHPTLVPLPIGAFAFALASDVAFVATRDPFWARASRLLLGTGIATGAVAAVLGATDFVGRGQVRERREAWIHAGGNAAALALSAVNLGLRRRGSRGAVPAGLALAALTGAILVATGWLGGELSYRYKIGVMD